MARIEGVTLEGPPQRLDNQYSRIFTKGSIQFLRELLTEFDSKVDLLLLEREKRRINITTGNWKPKFQKINEIDWKIGEIPQRIRNRKLDLGDISPANTINFTDALYANVQGIQVWHILLHSIFLLIDIKIHLITIRLILMMVIVRLGVIQSLVFTM